jgi:hypothetical protein
MIKIINFSKKQFLRIGYCLKELTIFFTEGLVVFSICSVFIVISSILVNFVFNIFDFYNGTDIMNSVIAKSFIENPNMSINLCIFEYVISSGMLGVFVGLFILSLYVGVRSILKTIVKDWRES